MTTTHTPTHTPTPWIVIDNLREVDAIGIYADNGGMLICELRDPDDAEDSLRMQANAGHIVHCVNVHDELVAALKDLYTQMIVFNGAWKEASVEDLYEEVMTRADTALTHAEQVPT